MNSLPKSVKLNDSATEFFKKMRLNLIRTGASEKALNISYADLMDLIINYYKSNNIKYTEMLEGISENV